MIDNLFKNTKILEKAVDASWMRNGAISQNIANVDTPGYKRVDVPFEDYLSKAMDNAGTSDTVSGGYTPVDAVDVDNIDLKVQTDNSSSLSMRIDGNNVDPDSEMAALAKNSIRYNVLIQSMNSEFRRLRTAITEGR
ncbi:MAG: flagellar basal body rod protein FlgB [Bacillota bacterium]|nr:flagellar basal body rod protein FlgB [Bacillota bacterium]